ncbi:endonuclease/exonuclease/phosphatase family protein [Vibrio vulnificus]|nr:endonuclease/exonuclease/phosphatase family protein [Vibrio vulnificus]
MVKQCGLWFLLIASALFYWGLKEQVHLWWAENIASYPAIFLLPLFVIGLMSCLLKAWLTLFTCLLMIVSIVMLVTPPSIVVKSECHNPKKIFQYNMLYSNRQVNKLIAHLVELVPDLVILQEVTPNHFDQLKVLDRYYQYRFGGQPKVGLPSHQLIFSKQPLYGMNVFYIEGEQNFTRGIWQFDSGHSISLFVAHPPSPRNQELWKKRNALIQALEYQAANSPTSHILIVGDINLSASSARFQSLFRAMKTLPVASWPNHPNFSLPAWLQVSIDHLWLESDIEVCKREVVKGLNGSDHNAVTTYLNPR